MKLTIYFSPDGARRNPWFITYWSGRKRFRKYFKSRADAERYAAEVRRALNLGSDPKEIATALKLIAGTGYPLTTVVLAGIKQLQSTAVGHPRATSLAVTPSKAT